MSTENDLIEIRKRNHIDINGGIYPLALEGQKIGDVLFTFNSNVQSLNPQDLGNSIIINGRIKFIRRNGGIAFVKLTDGTGSVQIIFSKAVLGDSFTQLKLLDLGDIISVDGKACLSKTNEKSLLVTNWSILTKAHRPPPEKYLGISNVETKYRKRYLDLMSDIDSRSVFAIRSRAIRAIRDFMESNDFMEVETSTLNSVNSGANAKPFTTHHNALDTDLFLRIAPELYLKRLLVGGFDRVYEIGRNYRNEGIDTRHNPEFTMIEFYEAYASFPKLIKQTKSLLTWIDYQLNTVDQDIFWKPFYDKCRAERTFASWNDSVSIPMFDAVNKACDKAELIIGDHINVLDQPGSNMLDLHVNNMQNERLQKIDIKGLFNSLTECLSSGEKIAVLFEYVAEPFLTEDYRTEDGKLSLPVFITEYPSAICPLARRSDRNPNLCDRFELFVDGRELANAFQELNDPDEQAEKFQEQLIANSKDAMDYDADYVEALEYGMPPATGFGMGIERLVMLLVNAKNIRDVILFPTLKPVVK
ncbi:LysU Lysyl-tRNA synthetase (class II) [uncultured Caudovirales phage]|uniref:lysine--tRNA ligase n=1 Tax=uncultured Caudovirales phage TaxID=2100421 RepID=A0A6J5RHD7_9CAUD|nr:LysU Lysyl-tRNA synthetase (class II) [uncultured Caudovirales phage]